MLCICLSVNFSKFSIGGFIGQKLKKIVTVFEFRQNDDIKFELNTKFTKILVFLD